MTDFKLNAIKQRLSLREPLKEALDVFATILTAVPPKKGRDLTQALESIKALYPTCADFQREFPSVAFNIATGVGKTRLMGAMVAYLYLQYGVKNFFILAPNLTIYEKLKRDFSDTGYSKYVFRGIAEFVHNQPVIIHGDNYQSAVDLFIDTEIHINIFNISKFNSESSGKRGVPRIKRLSEYLGESYWSYLSGLTDLVLLMDEAHRYHADASKQAINELQPALGVELTATPVDEKNQPFKNIVYEYTLAHALRDKRYVKNPTIATRKNFDPKDYTPEEIEKIKLEDAVSLHRTTKNEIEIYANNNKVKKVKPFILVVCKDMTHAETVFNYVSSNEFYQGYYTGKVLKIDSSTKNVEEVERQFVGLEQYENEIEIVIHVNMLKEGWDVNNLYTIVPLRAANASTLIEQTIGRGLRLPYNGERTGAEYVDKLTVVAHENFKQVIEEAQNPESILNKFSTIVLDENEAHEEKQVVVSETKTTRQFAAEQAEIALIPDEGKRQERQEVLSLKQAVLQVLPEFAKSAEVAGLEDLNKPEIQEQIINRAIEVSGAVQSDLFFESTVAEVKASYQTMIKVFKENTIEIPRMDLTLGETVASINDFDLDTSKDFHFTPNSEKILVAELTGEGKTKEENIDFGIELFKKPEDLILAKLLDLPEIDYDKNPALLRKLVNQAVEKLREYNPEEDNLKRTVRQFLTIIVDRIYQQILNHFTVETASYTAPKVLPFTKIEEWSFSALKDGERLFNESIEPKSMIPRLVFTGFVKAAHAEYKFDSETEQTFAYILENDSNVLRWMRPAPNQFRLYYDKNRRRYEPDFVVETETGLYIVETKSAAMVLTEEVQQKKAAAETFCEYATTYNTAIGKKPWRYLIIPHDQITRTNTFEYLVKINLS